MNPFVLIDGVLVNVQFIVKAWLSADGLYVMLGLADGSSVRTGFSSIEEFMFAYQGWQKSMMSKRDYKIIWI